MRGHEEARRLSNRFGGFVGCDECDQGYDITPVRGPQSETNVENHSPQPYIRFSSVLACSAPGHTPLLREVLTPTNRAGFYAYV